MKVFYWPFLLQGMVMVLDELLHLKRGLPSWERVGHPLDTATVMAPLSYAAVAVPSEGGKVFYAALAVFSCLFITKDEWVHAGRCSALEQWLHALLFMLHPLIFVAGWFLWRQGDSDFLKGILAVMGFFLFYQILRWSVLWRMRKE